MDQLQYLHDEACHSQDYSDGRRKVEEVAPVSGNVCVGRGTDGYIVYTVDTCMSTPPTWLEVATCTCIYSVTVAYATYSIYEAYPLPSLPLPPPPCMNHALDSVLTTVVSTRVIARVHTYRYRYMHIHNYTCTCFF